MNQLLARPIPYENESPGSILLRASCYNGWASPTRLLSVVTGKPLYSIKSLISYFINPEKYYTACDLLGVRLNNMNICYSKSGNRKNILVNYLGIDIPEQYLRLSNPAICPRCIEDSDYHRAIWDHKLVTSCTKHNVELLDYCPDCGEKISWKRNKINRCNCGFLFHDHEAVHVDTEATEKLEYLINTHSKDEVARIHRTYDLLYQFHRFSGSVISDHELSSIAINAFDSQNILQEHIGLHIKKTAGIHPRLMLIPFLQYNHNGKDEIAKNILHSVCTVDSSRPPPIEQLSLGLKEASIALGISMHLTRNLISSGIISAEKKTNNSCWKIQFSSINVLLFTLNQASKEKDENSPIDKVIEQKDKSSFARIIKEVISGKRESFGFDISRGIGSLLVGSKKTRPKDNNKLMSNYVTISQLADLCGVHYENIRFTIKSGFIKSSVKSGGRILIPNKEAKQFRDTYDFAGAFARKQEMNPRNIAEKLMAYGLQPVSGPSIDGGLTYLFRKYELQALDISVLKEMNNYPTKTGRKRADNIIHAKDPTFSEVAHSLGISIQRVRTLVNKGILEEVKYYGRANHISIGSLSRLKEKLQDDSLVDLDKAAKYVGETIFAYRTRWIQTNFINIVDLGLYVAVTQKDLDKVKRFKSMYITCQEAGVISGKGRSFLPNLQKLGKIKPEIILKGTQCDIKLFNRQAVDRLI